MFGKLLRYVAIAVSTIAFASIAIMHQSAVDAWGPQGHIAVASIAQSELSATTFDAVSKLIPDGDLASVANWADTIRGSPQWHWTEPLHFIDTPDWACNYIPSRDCFNPQGQSGYCVDGAIQNNTMLLQDRSSYSLEFNAENLKFLVHFVGDIHQPLHCGFTSDRGGNSIKVHFKSHSTNLHSLWDSGLIEERIKDDFGGDMNKWIAYLISESTGRNASASCVGCSPIWGNSSAILACSNAYVGDDGVTHIQQGAQLDMNYYKRNIVVIEEQIILGGLRLAALLNATFVQ